MSLFRLSHLFPHSRNSVNYHFNERNTRLGDMCPDGLLAVTLQCPVDLRSFLGTNVCFSIHTILHLTEMTHSLAFLPSIFGTNVCFYIHTLLHLTEMAHSLGFLPSILGTNVCFYVHTLLHLIEMTHSLASFLGTNVCFYVHTLLQLTEIMVFLFMVK